MKMKKLLFSITLFFLCHVGLSQIVINELDCDTPSTDDKEFVELKSDAPNFALDGYVVVFFNGSVSGSVVWKVSERRVYISGTETMDDSESKEYEL